MLQQIDQLQKSLEQWEDKCFFESVCFHLDRSEGKTSPCPLEGPLVHEVQLRQLLLHALSQPFDADRFMGSDAIIRQLGPLSLTPLLLYLWSRSSRRVYHLTSEVQEILRHTSLRGVKLGDVSFPFSSFAVTLSHPLVNSTGGAYDCIVYGFSEQGYNFSDGPAHVIQCLPTTLQRYEPLAKMRRDLLKQKVSKKKWSKVKEVLKGIQKRILESSPLFLKVPHEPMKDMLVANDLLEQVEVVGAQREASLKVVQESLNILVGLTLYLKGLPPDSPSQSKWRPPFRSGNPDPKAVSNEAQVCTVSSSYTLSKLERIGFGLEEGTPEERAYFERCCTTVEGHWRRLPGYGHLPDAPKVVQVHPYILRRDRLQEGELPGGSEKTI